MAQGLKQSADYNHAETIALAATLFSINGSIQATADQVGYDRSTVSQWQKLPEFIKQFNDAELERASKLKAKLKTIIEDGYEQIHDRILNGDSKVVAMKKDGQTIDYQVVKVPMMGRDLAVATGIVHDKLLLPALAQQREDQVGRLEQLMAKLELIADAKVVATVDNSVDK